MRALELTLKSDPGQRLDLSPLTPDRLKGLSEKDIASIDVHTTKEKLALGDAFDIKSGDIANIRFKNLNSKSDHVGDGLESGSITIDGDAGAYSGARMRGGKLEITGNSGDYAGASMKGGHLIVKGNTGNYAGGRHHAENQGIRGGILQIFGNTGDHVAERMRRGIVLVNGNAGAFAASRMIAGTLIISGTYGRCPAYGMRRGTVLLSSSVDLLPTFADCGIIDLPILKMIKRNLDKIGAGSQIPTSRVVRFAGDMASLGKGEILIPA